MKNDTNTTPSYDVTLSLMVNVTADNVADPAKPTDEEADGIVRLAIGKILRDPSQYVNEENLEEVKLCGDKPVTVIPRPMLRTVFFFYGSCSAIQVLEGLDPKVFLDAIMTEEEALGAARKLIDARVDYQYRLGVKKRGLPKGSISPFVDRCTETLVDFEKDDSGDAQSYFVVCITTELPEVVYRPRLRDNEHIDGLDTCQFFLTEDVARKHMYLRGYLRSEFDIDTFKSSNLKILNLIG